MWRRWTINRAADQEQKLSLVDDWSHCCCSWLKRRGVASMGCGRAVFSQKTVQTFPFHLMLSTCSCRSEPSYFPFDALNFLLTLCLSLTPFFISHHLCSIRCSKARMGEPIFPPGTCMIDVWTCKLYEELALRGVTYGRNSCMMKQESWFLPKLYNENFLSDGHWVTQKSWVQDASRRVCLDAKQYIRSTYPKGRF